MEKKRKIGFILEGIVVLIFMTVLSSIAVPQIGQMVNDEREESHAEELHIIQTAVTKMLADSPARAIKPVGPTQDMGEVETTDETPLVLTDYLDNNGAFNVTSECYYTFSAEGIVTQECR